jgi:hypothetical protein
VFLYNLQPGVEPLVGETAYAITAARVLRARYTSPGRIGKGNRSLQLSVFRLGLLENRDIGVGVFPEGEKILVRSLRLGLISRQSQRSA